MAINSRAKGARGELEFCEWLYLNFPMEKQPTRHLGQSRDGGADVICPPFIFEVKRREAVDHYSFWNQVHIAQQDYFKETGYWLEPVVAYRKNREPWSFLISGKFMKTRGYVMMPQGSFVEWCKRYLAEYQKMFDASVESQDLLPTINKYGDVVLVPWNQTQEAKIGS